jgi:hypothetical protein
MIPSIAHNSTACATGTAVAVAWKLTLVALAGTVTMFGTLTAGLVLTTPTLTPPLPAGAVKVTVQESVAAPVIVELPHDMPFSTPVCEAPVGTLGGCTPRPLSPIVGSAPVVALLITVTCPVD